MSDEQQTQDAAPAAPGGGGGKSDPGTIIGIVMGFGAVIGGVILEGASIGTYMAPTAAIIVIGGTMGACIAAVGLNTFMTVPPSIIRAMTYKTVDRASAIVTLVGFAEKARREGLLVLEDQLQDVEDEFLKRGVQLVVDGTDPELVKEILQTEIDTLADEQQREFSVFEKLGGYSPTLGIIAAVMGLVLVLSDLSSGPEHMGPAIAIAFVGTFYGVILANLVYLPIFMRLKACSEDEVSGKELMIEGILAIQSGDNPRIVEEKLVAFLDRKSKAAFRASRAAEDEFDLAA